jgi:4-hydroxy-tetrahydrodipicolinate reductase
MGREVDASAQERGVEVVARLDVEDVKDRAAALEALRAADVVIAFTVPESAVADIELCLEAGTPVVVGTTGWYDELDAVKSRVREQGGTLLHAPNFSMGVALVKSLLERAAEMLPRLEGFDVSMTETHHAAKKDAPSGTALLLKGALERGGFPRPIDVASTRVGFVPGIHSVGFDGPAETITLTHTVRDRATFAHGALVAARWVRGRRGWFTMRDVLEV